MKMLASWKIYWFVTVTSMMFLSLCVSAADEKGKNSETKNLERQYVKKEAKACATLKLTCNKGEIPFSDTSGCGCEKQKPLIPSKYQSLTIKEAGITLEFPPEWIQMGDKTAWAPNSQGLPLIGFKWEEIQPDWEPLKMLPKQNEFLGPFMIDLGWEQGLLFIVQTQQQNEKKKDNKDNHHELMELHVVIPRMEAQLAYDFYTRGKNLMQLKEIETATQYMMQSGALESIKYYISENLQECKELEPDCSVSEKEFVDEKGCGCLILPTDEPVYDN
jgi:hypothetical protein